MTTPDDQGAAAAAVAESATPATKDGKQKKGKPKNLVIPPKKPKLSKAERRALQEAQRAAKAGVGGGGKGGGGKGNQGGKKQQQQQPKQGNKGAASNKNKQAPTSKSTTSFSQPSSKENDKSVSLFSHLPPYYGMDHFPQNGVTLGGASQKSLHPAVLQVGLLYAKGTIRGGNARCRAMLHAFHAALQSYTPPPDCKDIRQHLDQSLLKPSFNFWAQHCRPHSVSMGNAFTLLKSAVAAMDRSVTQPQLVEVLCETIKAYERERIDFADRAIAEHASSKIVNGDVILVYGHSQVIQILLKKAHETTLFRVLVVDSRPLLEGKQMLEELRSVGIECSYIYMNSLSYVLKEVTKVFLGASALLSDGSVLSRVGTACIALMATNSDKPVLVCCETYKMSTRVQLESITGNELGNPDCVASDEISDWKQIPNLRLLNLLYDLTPADFVSGIVTEMGILPPTSVAVLLREMNHVGGAS